MRLGDSVLDVIFRHYLVADREVLPPLNRASDSPLRSRKIYLLGAILGQQSAEPWLKACVASER